MVVGGVDISLDVGGSDGGGAPCPGGEVSGIPGNGDLPFVGVADVVEGGGGGAPGLEGKTGNPAEEAGTTGGGAGGAPSLEGEARLPEGGAGGARCLEGEGGLPSAVAINPGEDRASWPLEIQSAWLFLSVGVGKSAPGARGA